MHKPVLLVLTTSLVGGAVIHVSPARPSLVYAPRVTAETSLVVPAGSRLLTQLAQPLSVRSVRPGDTIYLRLASAVVVSQRVVIPVGTFVEATVTNVPDEASATRLEIGLRIRRLINAEGDIADVFAVGGTPNDSAYRRGVRGVADMPGRDHVVTMSSTIAFVVESPFIVDTRRSAPTALGHKVRVTGSPPRFECLVQSLVPTPDVRIPGTPPTPAIGDVPGTPGTPDIVIPGTPSVVEVWQPCY